MLSVHIEGADKIEATLDSMMETINDFPVPMAEEFVKWQRQDMRRTYPNFDIVDPKTIATSIWPRSRASARYYRRKQIAQQNKGPRQKRIVIKSTGRTKSKRPILRPILFDKLCERMAALMEKVITWR